MGRSPAHPRTRSGGGSGQAVVGGGGTESSPWARGRLDGGGCTRGQGLRVLTFSPVSVTTSRGPYMKRPFSTWGRPSHTTVSLARWLEVTFWREETA